MAGLRPNLRRYLVSRRFYSVREVAEAATSQEIETSMFQKDKEGKTKTGQTGDKGKNRGPFLDPSSSSKVLIRRDPSMIRERISSASFRDLVLTVTRSDIRHQSVVVH